MIALIAIAGLFLSAYGFLVLRAWYAFSYKTHPSSEIDYFPFVSVLVAARNEADHIQICLHSLLQQSYPQDKYEVILIDDESEDETANLGKALQAEYPNLKIIHSSGQGKKAALSCGVAVAQGEIILQTDADCAVKKHWMSSMMAYFDRETAFVSGPVLLTGRGFFQRIQILEFLGLNALGGGSMAAGHPNMCNGANLAYRKSVFEEVKGYQGIDGIASGDDELLLQKIHALRKYKIRYAKSFQAIVETAAMPTLRRFWMQRLRWVSKARAYENKWINLSQLILFFAIFSIFSLFALGIYDRQYALAGLILLGIKTLLDLPLMWASMRFFRQENLKYWLFLLEFAYFPYVIGIGAAGNLVKHYSWKGRKTQ